MSTLLGMAVENPMFQQAAIGHMMGQKQESSFGGWGADESGGGSGGGGANGGTILRGVDEEELYLIEKWVKILRVGMIIISTLMAITAFYNFLNAANDMATNLLAFYVLFFSILICCYEISMRMIAIYIVQNFGFLYNPAGRTLFYIFCAFLCWSLSVMGKVAFALLITAIAVRLVVDCKHPKLEQYLMIKHFHGRVDLENQQSKSSLPRIFGGPAKKEFKFFGN